MKRGVQQKLRYESLNRIRAMKIKRSAERSRSTKSLSALLEHEALSYCQQEALRDQEALRVES